MKYALITGGTGFVGWYLSHCLIDGKYPAFCWDANRFTYKKYLDVDGRRRLLGLKQDSDYIIHLAPVPVDEVIECARKTGARILFASSGAVYDKKPDAYGKLKIASEKKLLASGLDVRIARMFTFIGHGLPEHLAPVKMLRSMQAGQPMLCGEAVRSYMDAEDMARWLWAILLDAEPMSVYDVGSDVPVTMGQLAEQMGKGRSGSSWQAGAFKEPRKTYLPNIKPIQNDLGVKITIPLEMAVERFIRSY